MNLPRRQKEGIVVAVDIVSGLLAMWGALAFRNTAVVPSEWPSEWIYLVAVSLAFPVFLGHGMYRAVFRYTGLGTLMTIARAVAIYATLLLVALLLLPFGLPWSLAIMQPLLLLTLLVTGRTLVRYWFGVDRSGRVAAEVRPRLLIYGAGASGAAAAAAIERSRQFTIIGFLDDDSALVGLHINGHPIYSPAELEELVARFYVTDVLLAMPQLARSRRNDIIAALRRHPVHVRTVPPLPTATRGRNEESDAEVRELDIEDLLGRDPVPPVPHLLERNNRGRVVLVTGAGGSIGGELCRQLLAIEPELLLLVDSSEFALYSIHGGLESQVRKMAVSTRIVPLLGSVCDARRMNSIMDAWKPDIVYHAAAYKHVPMVEHNPIEGVRNNVFGTLVTAQAAVRHSVGHFVLISTDKAVRPTNVMGATKRLAELVLQALAEEIAPNRPNTRFGSFSGSTCFCMVRFGNVLGSSGSVVPLFRDQIQRGGPLTVTHREVTRYFMTIPEAAQLVIQAGAMAQGGDVFVLDMGQPIRIADLAVRMIELSGLRVRDEERPDGDIELVFTGLRPGEKLYEELLIGEHPQATAHPRIMKAHEEFLRWPVLQDRLRALEHLADSNDAAGLRVMLEQLVAGYAPANDLVDWVYLARPDGAPVDHHSDSLNHGAFNA